MFLHRLPLYKGLCSNVSAQTVLVQRPMQHCICTDCACTKAYAALSLQTALMQRPMQQCVCTDCACSKAIAPTVQRPLCVCIRIHVYMHVCVCVCVCASACTRVCVCVRASMHACVSACVRAYMNVCMHACLCGVEMYAIVYARVLTCAHVCWGGGGGVHVCV